MPLPAFSSLAWRPTCGKALRAAVTLAVAWLVFDPATLAAGMRLVDFGKLGVDSQITVNGSAEVATQIVEDPRGKSLEVRCTPGANPAPGVVIRPGETLDWNLAYYGAVEADVTNLSDSPLVINLRVDNPGGGHQAKGNTDKIALPVGKSGTVRAYFGYTMGEKAYALEPAKISQVVIFTSKLVKGSATFRVTALRAVGKPGDKPVGSSPNDTATPAPTASPTPNVSKEATSTPASPATKSSSSSGASPTPVTSFPQPTASPTPNTSPSLQKVRRPDREANV